MTICPNCGERCPEKAKFCLECGSPLRAAAPKREVRKTVTVLFCDLVDSTEVRRASRPRVAARADAHATSIR